VRCSLVMVLYMGDGGCTGSWGKAETRLVGIFVKEKGDSNLRSYKMLKYDYMMLYHIQ